MSLPPKPWLSPEALDQIVKIGKEAAPREACGILSPDLHVTALPNRSERPTSSYLVSSDDLVEAIETYLDRSGVNPEALSRGHFIVWHTHPGGLIGPSRGDLDTKVPGFIYYVIAIPSGYATKF